MRQPEASGAAGEAPELVLIVDDDGVVRAIVSRTLERAGYRVVAARDGEEALLLARENEPDLLLLDVVMPGVDGFRVCREIQAAGPTAPPVIFLTGQASTEERIAGLDTGAVDYVVKPFDARELVARVRAALRTKKALDALATSAGTDALTGLPNRAQLDGRLAEEVASARRFDRPLSCLMVDLDNFKQINDTFGHAAGDLFLREVARRLRGAVRVSDVIGRFGGDEFLLLLPDTDAAGARVLAAKLHGLLDGFDLAAAPEAVPVRASIGVATWDAAMGSPEALAEAADGALYSAKRNGRNRVMEAADQSPRPAA